MQIPGFNKWAFDTQPEFLTQQALAFADDVRARGIAELREAYLATDERLMWCTWDTEDLEGFRDAFEKMNEQSGLESVLTRVESFYT